MWNYTHLSTLGVGWKNVELVTTLPLGVGRKNVELVTTLPTGSRQEEC